MTSTLSEYLSTHKPAGFRSEATYFVDGDFLTYFLSNDPYYAERYDDMLTMYKSETTGELIGCKLKGVKLLVDKMGEFSFSVTDGKVKLGPLLVTAAMVSRKDSREIYRKLASKMSGAEATFPHPQLAA